MRGLDFRCGQLALIDKAAVIDRIRAVFERYNIVSAGDL